MSPFGDKSKETIPFFSPANELILQAVKLSRSVQKQAQCVVLVGFNEKCDIWILISGMKALRSLSLL